LAAFEGSIYLRCKQGGKRRSKGAEGSGDAGKELMDIKANKFKEV
jgi:hypothetical protein